jgi:hypothetical protein
MDNDIPVPFGYKMAWIAIRTPDREAVVRSLELRDTRETSWQEGIDTIYRDGSLLFITPAVKEWTMVVGWWTAHAGDEQSPAAVEELVTRLSTEFGEAQAFATHRVVEAHHWILARDGRLLRSFAYLGESGRVLANKGEPTGAEQSMNFRVLSAPEELDEQELRGALPNDDEWWAPNEEDVMSVAGHWSINPQDLGTSLITTGQGLLAHTPIPVSPLDKHSGSQRRPWWRFW